MNEDNVEPVIAPEYKPPVKTVWFIAIMGVLLPIVAIAVEAAFRFCQGAFFDPFPTFYHGVLIAMVPLANAMLVRALVLEDPTLPPALAWLHPFAMGVSLLYAILFLPLTPFAPLAIIWFGFGFLPLAPLLSLVAAMLGRKAIKRLGATPPVLWRGMALALAAFIALDTPAAITRIGLQLATADAPGTRVMGVRWLRVAGSEDILLHYCYAQSGLANGLIGSLLELNTHISPEQARLVFYRVTGAAFNSRPAPAARGRYDWRGGFDWDLGDEQVGQRTAGVTLASSRMDGSVDAQAALGYLEWTMVFKNSSTMQQEGRAELLLPPGAVVSRATLWIDGEEREAAFGGRGQVRAAYAKVVRQSRDPLLVTTAGPDRVLVQLFPIPPHGEMKIRIGMTAPMALRDLRSARLQLPLFSERNFDLKPGLRHMVWIESASALQGGPGMRAEKMSNQLFALRGELEQPLTGRAIEAVRKQPGQAMWSKDDQGGDGQIIVQTLDEQAASAPHRVAIVIDGSVSMHAYKAQLIEGLAAIPPGAETAYVFAGDAEAVVVPGVPSKRYLESLDFEGGRDNSKALAAAWDWAGALTGGAIVWIHGDQPDAGDAVGQLLQRIERRPVQVALYDLEAAPGPNAIMRNLDGRARMHRVAREGDLSGDLRALFGQWAPGATQVVVTRQRQHAGGMQAATKTSSHLARLWAFGQVAALATDPKQANAATAMAVRYQLVTPVSGAVVLETKQQYDEAGLEPVAPGSVPTIPEPETWLLLIVALCVLGLRYRQRAS